jgi:hypothetical protein
MSPSTTEAKVVSRMEDSGGMYGWKSSGMRF